MHDYVDLDSWLASALLPECTDPTPQGTILRRRAAIVIGQWVMKMTDVSRAEYDSGLARTCSYD